MDLARNVKGLLFNEILLQVRWREIKDIKQL